MQVTFVVEGPTNTIKISLDQEFTDREEALTKMDEVHKDFKRLYPEYVILVKLRNSTFNPDMYILQ